MLFLFRFSELFPDHFLLAVPFFSLCASLLGSGTGGCRKREQTVSLSVGLLVRALRGCRRAEEKIVLDRNQWFWFGLSCIAMGKANSTGSLTCTSSLGSGGGRDRHEAVRS